MKELKPTKKFLPPNKAKDSQGLASLVGFLNNPLISGAAPPPKEELPSTPVAVRTAAPVATLEPTPVIPTQPVPAIPQATGVTSVPKETSSKIFYTGRLMVGKDYCAIAAGQTVFSLAEPLYALQKLFFRSDDKTLPGAREFLQTAGQIGRGIISADYPLSIPRANFVALVRDCAMQIPENLYVQWDRFGLDENLWLDALVSRINNHLATHPNAKVAVTNVRFGNEMKRLAAEGFVHRHVLCSAATWTARLKKVGLTPDSPECKNTSEQLATALDNDVTKRLSQKAGARLWVIWSDPAVGIPSNRILSLPQYVASFK